MMYDFQCEKCDGIVEMNVPSAERDNTYLHDCGGKLKRTWLSPPASGVGAFQMKAVMYNQHEQKVGHVPGHFGKLAKRKKSHK